MKQNESSRYFILNVFCRAKVAKLFLLRHLKSQWNKDNRFAGWADNPLSDEGKLQAREISNKLAVEKIDIIYTSSLIRNMETILRIFDNITGKYPLFSHLDGGKMQLWGNFERSGSGDVPVCVSEKLNERYYGKLQGLNKEETVNQYGEEKVRLWRRAFNAAPPEGESLKDVYKRTVPFFKKYAEKNLRDGKNVLIVASHNSLRALVKYIEKISDEKIADVELPFGALVIYGFDEKNFSKYN